LEEKEKYSSMLYEEFGKENKIYPPIQEKKSKLGKKTLFPFLRKRVCNKHKNYHGQIILNMHKS
jgi:hypothetical protein